jgi:hypothetical protein
MFGGRWNRGHGIRINKYIPHLIEKIKQDGKNEEAIEMYSTQPRLLTSRRLKSGSCNPNNNNMCPCGSAGTCVDGVLICPC